MNWNNWCGTKGTIQRCNLQWSTKKWVVGSLSVSRRVYACEWCMHSNWAFDIFLPPVLFIHYKWMSAVKWINSSFKCQLAVNFKRKVEREREREPEQMKIQPCGPWLTRREHVETLCFSPFSFSRFLSSFFPLSTYSTNYTNWKLFKRIRTPNESCCSSFFIVNVPSSNNITRREFFN